MIIMTKIKIMQWICISLMIIGVIGMGVHLFIMDGVTHPTNVLTVFAVIFAIGMVGNFVIAVIALWFEQKEKNEKE